MNTIRKYPKLFLLLGSMILAYGLFMSGGLLWLHNISDTGETLASFIAGAFFTFGFTAAFGIGMFVEIAHAVNPLTASIAGAFGALLADLAIFQIMRFELFHEEISLLKTSRLFRSITSILHHERFPERVRHYLMWVFAGMIIASPLPDEFGVALVSSLTEINRKTFAVISFLFNWCGILLLLLGARAIAF